MSFSDKLGFVVFFIGLFIFHIWILSDLDKIKRDIVALKGNHD